MEAFSDGVIAIIITIMVLELRVPHASTFEALTELYPVGLSYALSFIYVAIYWNNHHHMLHTASAVSGLILWANLHLLFWLSLIPFATAWMGENHFATIPTQFYGVILFMAGIAYYLLSLAIISYQGPDSLLKKAIGSDWKGKLSPICYLLAILAAQWAPSVAMLIYVFVAAIWVVPDSRIGKLYHT